MASLLVRIVVYTLFMAIVHRCVSEEGSRNCSKRLINLMKTLCNNNFYPCRSQTDEKRGMFIVALYNDKINGLVSQARVMILLKVKIRCGCYPRLSNGSDSRDNLQANAASKRAL